MKNKIYIPWSKIDEDFDHLFFSIARGHIKFEAVYGIPRGGLILAVMLSHRLGIPLLLNVEDVILYNKQSKKVLIVDEIVDSGKTVKNYSNFGYIASLYVRYSSGVVPDFFSEKIMTDDWLVFPWEEKISI